MGGLYLRGLIGSITAQEIKWKSSILDTFCYSLLFNFLRLLKTFQAEYVHVYIIVMFVCLCVVFQLMNVEIFCPRCWLLIGLNGYQ